MSSKTSTHRFGKHENAFGFARLFLASLVIASHTPELADGNRSRELLSRLFGTLSFGDLAVDGFFIVSGFLIGGSWLGNPRLGPYLLKRVTRIYPAFIVCSLICVFVVEPLGGASFHAINANLSSYFRAMVVLLPPQVTGAFDGTPFDTINGSAWTISYEFRCYLLIALLGLLGMLRRTGVLAALAIASYAALFIIPAHWIELSRLVPAWAVLYGELTQTFRLTPIFLVGTLFYINQDRIAYTLRGAVLCSLLLFLGMTNTITAEPALAIFGGYLILFFAHRGGGIFRTINNRNDVSYGLYLYAWPIEKLIYWYFPKTSLLVAGSVTLIFSYGIGWVSWLLIEKPALMRLGRRKAVTREDSQVANQYVALK